MGMLEDYNLVIFVGIIIVRLGRILFGERKNKKDWYFI